MTTDIKAPGIAHGELVALEGERVVFQPAHSSYRLHLAKAGPIAIAAGERIKGVIEGRALRLYLARAGGGFIEPLWGVPRIVQGRIQAVDETGNRLLVIAAAPLWVHVGDTGQSAAAFAPGQMVNFYLHSGSTFRPLPINSES